ncbi:MAG: hypothetical protein HQK58_12405 [Deltaproteobacteria bacterium]|nr:hypothetical protein [Deltaproteobacteria bacterium]
MISIEYTNDFLEGEPGPNFYWKGIPSDFLQLVYDLHPLGTKLGIEIRLNSLDYIQTTEDFKILLRSSEGGRNLCTKNKSIIMMDLDKNIWRRVIEKILSVSFEKSHNYIEFDDLELKESANVIVSSEA